MEQSISDAYESRTLRGVGPHPHDPRAFVVARRVAALIAAAHPRAIAEHVGSTAVAGLSGKGVVDLQITCAPGEVPAVTQALLSIGFRRQRGPDPFPPTRPMLEGVMSEGGVVFGLHCHVVPDDDPEALHMLVFRDELRRDPALAARYEALKRSIVAAGTSDVYAYTRAKSDFIRSAVAGAIANGRP